MHLKEVRVERWAEGGNGVIDFIFKHKRESERTIRYVDRQERTFQLEAVWSIKETDYGSDGEVEDFVYPTTEHHALLFLQHLKKHKKITQLLFDQNEWVRNIAVKIVNSNIKEKK